MKTYKITIERIFLLVSLFFALHTSAQAPNKISYQAVVRNTAGALVANTNVGIQISILQTTATGTAVYIERHTTPTNANGLATIEIGGGTLVSGNFTTIDWANGPYFIKTETDPTGGTTYSISGTSQMLSVPYALFAGASANNWGTSGNNATATNFIGTTNNNDLIFKRNGVLSGTIGTTNTAFGHNVLLANTTGTNNTSIGVNALKSNTIGRFNTAHGFSALSNCSTGDSNTAFGVDAMFFNQTGDNNTAVGINALNGSVSGSENTAIGAFAGHAAPNLTNSTAIGSRARVATSNSIVLGSVANISGASTSVNVGIGTISPQVALDIVANNVIPSVFQKGNLGITTNNAQAINVGASITLGGTNDNAGNFFRNFASIEGRKSNSNISDNSGYLIFKTTDANLLERMRITSVGDVGIGTPNPGGQFELSLNEGRKPISNTWTIPSDARLKTVKGDYNKGLNEIIQLQPIKYNYKNTDKRTFEDAVLNQEAFGFLAQQVQPIFPEAVGVDNDGYLNFDLHPILIASINAFKELNKKNEVLQVENQVFKQQLEVQLKTINKILKRLETLENRK